MERNPLPQLQRHSAKNRGRQRDGIGVVKRGRVGAPMRDWTFQFWFLRGLPVMLGIILTFWRLMIVVIANGHKAIRGRRINPRLPPRTISFRP